MCHCPSLFLQRWLMKPNSDFSVIIVSCHILDRCISLCSNPLVNPNDMQTIATKINENSFKAWNSEVWEKNSERSDSPDKHSTNSPIHQHILSNILFFYMQDQAVRSCCVSPASKHKVMTCGHCTWSDDTAAPRTEPQSVRIEHVTFTWLGLYSIWTPALSPVPWLLRQNLMFWTPFFLIYCINRTMFSCTPTLGIKKRKTLYHCVY